jgi:hypothetical protein
MELVDSKVIVFELSAQDIKTSKKYFKCNGMGHTA